MRGAFLVEDEFVVVLELGRIDFKKAENFLRNGEAEEITFFVAEFLNGIIKNGEKSFLFKQYFVINIYLTVMNFMKEMCGPDTLDDWNVKGSEMMKEVIGGKQKLKDYVVWIFTNAIEQRDIIRTKSYNNGLIEQAKEYINDHFSDEGLSLNETASHVNISPSHFSAVFSREAGKSFIRYLTDLRMNKAKEMLKCSNLRCSDISMAVGYKDPHYFSFLFKKTHSCSPMQYRGVKK